MFVHNASYDIESIIIYIYMTMKFPTIFSKYLHLILIESFLFYAIIYYTINIGKIIFIIVVLCISYSRY